MGILDSKERVLDTIVTREGRRQIATGEKFKPTYISFTDMHTFYKDDDVRGVASDATSRIYFEAVSLDQDSIIYEIDDSGNTLGFLPSVENIVGPDGGILSQSVNTGNGNISYVTLTDSAFASVALQLATGSFENFKKQKIVGNVIDEDIYGNKYEYKLSTNKIIFTVDNYKPFGTFPINFRTNVNSLKPLFYDEKLSHLPNFKFLPPVTKNGTSYGEYTDLSGESTTDIESLLEKIGPLPTDNTIENNEVDFFNSSKELQSDFGSISRVIEDSGLIQDKDSPGYQRKSVKFVNTNFSNSSFLQIFELGADSGPNKGKMTKLDLIDFGEFLSATDEKRLRKKVYFAGKVFIDDNNIPNFVNIFTIIFD